MDLILEIERASKPGEWKKQRIPFPEEWSDIKESCFHKISRNLFLALQGNKEAQKKIIYAVAENGIRKIEFKEATFELDEYLLEYIAPSLDWMFETHNVVQPFYSFKHNGIIYHISSDKLGNITMAEFDYLHYAYKKYVDTQNKDYALMITAILCREERKANTQKEEIQKQIDPRIEFYTELVHENTQKFKDLDLSILYSIMHYFIGSLDHINRRYKIFETKQGEDSNEMSGLPAPKFIEEEEEDWNDLMLKMSDGDLKKYYAYKNCSVYTFFGMIDVLNKKYMAQRHSVQ